MEQSRSWEANRHCQEISCFLWNPKFHYRVHKSPLLFPILSHMHPMHIFPPCFSKIHFNIIIPSAPRSFDCSLGVVNLFWYYLPTNLTIKIYLRYEVFTAVKILVEVLRAVTPCSVLPQHYTASQLMRPLPENRFHSETLAMLRVFVSFTWRNVSKSDGRSVKLLLTFVWRRS
jgi:hypothetical protein